MTTETALHARSESKCELCGSTENLGAYEVPPRAGGNVDDCAPLCKTCLDQIENPGRVA
jgi:protein PhnA